VPGAGPDRQCARQDHPGRQVQPRLRHAPAEGIFATTVTGDYPDEYDEIVAPSDSDMYLRPDADTVRMVPWASDPTAQIIHDCYTRDGRAHDLAPRNVLRRVLALYEGLGLKPVVAPELEFFLVQKNTDPDFPLQPPAGRSGARKPHGSRIRSTRSTSSIRSST
jgi:glutamine synthetase